MHKRIILEILALVCGILGIGIGIDIVLASAGPDTAQEQEYNTYVNEDYNFSIEYPSDWDAQEYDLQENDVVHFVTDEGPVRVIKRAITNTDLLPVDYRNLTLQELIDTSIEASGNSRTVSMTNTTLSGYPAVERVYYLYYLGVTMKSFEVMALNIITMNDVTISYH